MSFYNTLKYRVLPAWVMALVTGCAGSPYGPGYYVQQPQFKLPSSAAPTTEHRLSWHTPEGLRCKAEIRVAPDRPQVADSVSQVPGAPSSFEGIPPDISSQFAALFRSRVTNATVSCASNAWDTPRLNSSRSTSVSVSANRLPENALILARRPLDINVVSVPYAQIPGTPLVCRQVVSLVSWNGASDPRLFRGVSPTFGGLSTPPGTALALSPVYVPSSRGFGFEQVAPESRVECTLQTVNQTFVPAARATPTPYGSPSYP